MLRHAKDDDDDWDEDEMGEPPEFWIVFLGTRREAWLS